MLKPGVPCLILAPMEGITDAPMREFQGRQEGFTYAISEFVRVSADVLKPTAFLRHVPELRNGSKTRSGLPVQVQILGGDPERMAISAQNAVGAGATAIDINFGCPAKTVNRHDGGASLLKHPTRIRDIVSAVRSSVPSEIPVSAKLRLGWDHIESITENAAMAIEGGASWITIHARTRLQGYAPPVFWEPIGKVREESPIPVVANGDIWSIEDFLRCREITGCEHFMIGRGALANPNLSKQIANGLNQERAVEVGHWTWHELLSQFSEIMEDFGMDNPRLIAMRMKQWLKLASNQSNFLDFDQIKTMTKSCEILKFLEDRT